MPLQFAAAPVCNRQGRESGQTSLLETLYLGHSSKVVLGGLSRGLPSAGAVSPSRIVHGGLLLNIVGTFPCPTADTVCAVGWIIAIVLREEWGNCTVVQSR